MVIVTFVFYKDDNHLNDIPLNMDRLKDSIEFQRYVQQNELSFSREKQTNLERSPPRTNASSADGPKSVIVLVLSKLENDRRRSIIRKTFVQQNGTGVLMKTVFVAGKSSQQVFNDNSDDVITGQLIDTHQLSETDKIVSGIEWIVTNHPDVSFVFIVRDNMYVNYQLLQAQVDNRLNLDYKHNLWIGNVQKDLVPNQRAYSDWFVDEFALGGFPTFCVLDNGFGLSGGAVRSLHMWSLHESKHLPLGDVYIGYAAKNGSWAIMEDHQIIPPSYDSINVCAFKNQTITGTFESNEMWEMTLGDFRNFEKKFSKFCQDPDLTQILHKNVSNVDYFKKTLNVVVNPLGTCLDKNGEKLSNLTMIMIVNSHPNHFSRRKGIRATWAKQTTLGNGEVRILFVIGRTTKAGINGEVEVEAHRYNDIILTDMVESFKNLTLKLVLGLKWVSQNCKHAEYYYKGDDDMFVNTENILKAIHQQQKSGRDKLFMGALNKGEVIRDPWSKYYVSEEQYSGRFFSPFCSGGSYVISNKLIPRMYDKALITQLVPTDDTYQGMLAKLVGVSPVHHHGFKIHGGNYDTCSLQNEVLTVHGFTNEYEHLDVWKKFSGPC